jgi:hypothetical protein
MPAVALAVAVCTLSLGWTAHVHSRVQPRRIAMHSAAHKVIHASAAEAKGLEVGGVSVKAPADDFVSRKAALVEGLRREYDSFFRPMEEELYAPGITFSDPLSSLEGVAAYKKNVEMLSGESDFGRRLFADCGLVMHNVTSDSPESRSLCTRWTLQFRFKLLPWKPLAQFTGVSQYTIDDQARVLRQQDYWDSINLQPGGTYAPAGKISGLLDMLKQFMPRSSAEAAGDKELPYQLLRRAAQYEVRRYPQYIAVVTEYERRLDGLGTLGAYTGGANEASAELKAYVSRPLLQRPVPEHRDGPCTSVARCPHAGPACTSNASGEPRTGSPLSSSFSS